MTSSTTSKAPMPSSISSRGRAIIKTNYFGETELTENGPATIMVEIYTTKAGKVSRTLKTIQLGKVKENEVLAEIIW